MLPLLPMATRVREKGHPPIHSFPVPYQFITDTQAREEASTLLLSPFYLLLLLLQLPTSLCDKRRRRRSGGKRRRRRKREKRKVAQRYLLFRPPQKESLGEIPPQRRTAEWVPAQSMPFTTILQFDSKKIGPTCI